MQQNPNNIWVSEGEQVQGEVQGELTENLGNLGRT